MRNGSRGFGMGVVLFFLGVSRPVSAVELLQQHNARPLQAESTFEALRPWETPVSGFFIRSHLGVPSFDPDQWELRIDGMVEKPLTLKLSDLQKLSHKSLHAVLECAGNGRGLQIPGAPGVPWKRGAVGNAEWTGVPVAEVLKLARPKPGAKFVRVQGMDRAPKTSVPAYVRSIPIEKLLQPDSLLAWSMNREPIPLLHGAPLRLVLPGWYGQNWIKWITHITLTDSEDPGYYMKKAYRMPKAQLRPGEAWDSTAGAPIQELRVQSFIVSPEPGQVLKKGKYGILGKAFSGAGAISKVAVSLDSGKSWKEAQLRPRRETGGWQEFELQAEFSTEGPQTLMSRATDEKGNQQPLEQPWNPGGFVRNAVDIVKVEVGKEPARPGLAVVRSKCLMCHTQGMIEIQRLTPSQWEGVVKKMEGFGAEMTAPERTAVLAYLVQFSPERPRADPPGTNEGAEEMALQTFTFPHGNAASGAKLFSRNCAVCHGDHGEGKIGPATFGRNVPPLEFWQTVLYGKREMPAFGGQLKRQEIADIQSYLSKGGKQR